MSCIIHRWKYDLKSTHRRCVRCKKYQIWFRCIQEWGLYKKKEYVIALAETLAISEAKEKEQDKKYRKAKRYLTSIGRMDKEILV